MLLECRIVEQDGNGNPAISVEGVSKSFGDTAAVDNVDLLIGEGEFFSMLGPSGCGKTTTLRMIAGFEEPTSGRIVLRGEDVTQVGPAQRNLNMVFQEYGLFPHMTVADNVEFGLKVKGTNRAERGPRVAEAIESMQLHALERPRPRPPRPPPGRPPPAGPPRPRARPPPRRPPPRRAARRPRLQTPQGDAA